MGEQFSSKNPFFKHAEVKYFLVREGKKSIGRVASIINQRHIDFHKEKAGFFGFFECVNDSEVCSCLLDAVRAELGKRGLTIMRGPMNFSTNEECGFLVEGFDQSPMLMTPYNPPYYNDLMEQYGLHKAKDLYGFIHGVRDSLPEKVLRVAAIAEKRGITVRPVEKKRFSEEMRVFKEVYNSAWEKNWGFIPFTDEELDYLGERLKQIAVPELTLIAEDNGEPVGFMGLLPDFNYVLKRMNGRLNPLTILKALYYSKKIADLRLLLLGIKKNYRNKGVDALLFREGFAGVKKGGYTRIEFSWILEDNVAVQRIIDMIGGTLYKRYRVYEKEI
ncbi:MAG TPA: hypothetical protein VN328_04365 [Thermodesulfovibrionales bacterium]|nr:hypothetical protein [Thermodesulfovibrionales bacterium]